MNKNEASQFVKEALAVAIMKDVNSIHEADFLEADLGLDSIALASIIAKFEPLLTSHKDVNKSLHSLLSAETVGDLMGVISNDHVKVLL